MALKSIKKVMTEFIVRSEPEPYKTIRDGKSIFEIKYPVLEQSDVTRSLKWRNQGYKLAHIIPTVHGHFGTDYRYITLILQKNISIF